MSAQSSLKRTQSIVSVDDMPVGSELAHRRILVDHAVNKDEAGILSLGYKQEFKRELSFWSTLGVTFSVIGLLASIASTLFYSLAVAGNAGITWGFLIGAALMIPVALSMAEVASSFPTAGGLYYGTYEMAPKKCKVFFSWFVAWSLYLYQVTGAPSVAYSTANMFLALASLDNPNYEFQTWHCYLLTCAILTVCACVASAPTKWIARINSVFAVLNLVFLFISWVFMLGVNERKKLGLPRFNDNATAWGIENQTDWPDGMAILMSFLAVLWNLCGFDAPFHLAEECSNAQIAIPRAITMTAVISVILAFVFQIGMAYTIVDVVAAVNDDLGQPYIAYLNQILSHEKVLTIGAFAAVLSFSMTFSLMIAASRVLFAFSRDNLFPFSRYWCRVNGVTKTPVNAVWCNWFLGLLMNLLMFGGTAIDAIFSVGSISPFIAFTFPTLLRITCARNTFKPGPWSLGRFSTPCGIVACAYILVMIPISAWPQYKGANNTPDVMNWTVLVYYGPMLLIILWYFIYAHKVFHGPRSNLDKGQIVNEDQAESILEEDPSVEEMPKKDA